MARYLFTRFTHGIQCNKSFQYYTNCENIFRSKRFLSEMDLNGGVAIGKVLNFLLDVQGILTNV